MVYKYDEALFLEEKTFNLTNSENKEHVLVKKQIKLHPLYLISNGEIFYSGISHNQADIRNHFKKLIVNKMLGCSATLARNKTTKELLNELKLVTYHNIENFSYLNLWSAINCPAISTLGYKIPFDERNSIYTYDAIQLCNTVNKTKYLIDKKILEIASHYDSNEQFLSSLLKFYNYDFEEYYSLEKNSDFDLGKFHKSEKLSKVLDQIINDIFVQLIGFDKVESAVNKTITTSKQNIYETFFNFLLMEVNVFYIPKINLNSADKSFKYSFPNEVCKIKDREYYEEIELIKQKVPLRERKRYFL